MTNFGNVVSEYMDLLQGFLIREISVLDFRSEYLEKFKGEKRILDAELYNLLEVIFGDVDCFSEDPLLLEINPNFYLDERALRDKVSLALTRLIDLR